MSEQWSREYILLALRIDKAFRHHAGSWFVDSYYGPAAWKTSVEAESDLPASELVRVAISLADTLPEQRFEPHRAAHLEKQVRAMETVCRRLSGERFSLEEEVSRCFDVHPNWIPEEQFEQALTLYDEALPGQGNLKTRFLAWRTQQELTGENWNILQQALAEARRRTRTFVTLPTEEVVEVQTVTQKPFSAANWYLGNYRSRMEVNTDFPINPTRLIDLMCHEGYPGHHVEATLKEQQLYRERGYLEQAIMLVISPQLVISEGIAMLAFEMIFSAGEVEQWLAEHFSSQGHHWADGADILKLRRAADLLQGAAGNAVFLLHEGRSDEEVMKCLLHYTLEPEERLRKLLELVKIPLMEAYIFTYFYGKQLMQPWLQGDDRLAVFRRFLTEQVYPSELVRKA